MKISIIAAMGENRAIGFQGKIPWHLPADFKHFKELTMGHPIVMGRKTFESIGNALPGRTNIVISHDPNYKAEGCLTATSFEVALSLVQDTDEVFVCGGEQIYKQALPMAYKLYLTKVKSTFPADAFFPEFNESEWQIVSEENHGKDEKNAIDYAFLIYERR